MAITGSTITIEIPPFDDIDDNGNYIGNDPKFLKRESCMDKYKSDSSKKIDDIFKNATIVDMAKIRKDIQESLEQQAKEEHLAEIAEKQRIDRMVCPVCKSNNKSRHMLTENNGVFGPGYSSHVILDFYICNDCGVHYSDLNKKK